MEFRMPRWWSYGYHINVTHRLWPRRVQVPTMRQWRSKFRYGLGVQSGGSGRNLGLARRKQQNAAVCTEPTILASNGGFGTCR